MWSYNRGEWSEPYVFLKLLEEGVLYAADSALNKMSDIYYPVIKILREEFGESMEYLVGDEIVIKRSDEARPMLRVPLEEFKNKSLMLLDRIQNAPSKTGSFEIPEVEAFLKNIRVRQVKSDGGSKRDITVVVHDTRTGLQPTLGFSIKSKLGSPPTLLNPSGATNFIYRAKNVELNNNQIQNINDRPRVIDIINAVESLGGNLEYAGNQNDVFKQNMQIIDSRLPEIMGHLLLTYYSTDGLAALKPILGTVSSENPCNYSVAHGHPFYEYKVKKFLAEVALGMVPATVWKGTHDATGGYIVVRSDGEVLCYHLYNRNEFEDYLINNTKFETPGRGRYKYGKLYNENGQTFMKLCLQIRFK